MTTRCMLVQVKSKSFPTGFSSSTD